MPINTKLSALTGVLTLSLSFISFESHAEGLTTSIREQLLLARDFDPQYASTVASRSAAEQGLIGARAGLGPRVTLSAGAFRSDRKEETGSSPNTVEVESRINSHITQVQARQPIYRKRSMVEVEQAQVEFEAARDLVLAAEQDLKSRLLAAWLEVLAARDQIEVQAKAVSASLESFLEVGRRKNSGESTVQDVDIAEARLMQSQALLEDAQAKLEIANRSLQAIAGPKARVPEGALLRGLSQFLAPLRAADEVIDLIAKANFEVRGLRFQEDSARFEREKAKSDRYPTVEAYALASRGDNDAVSTIKDEQRIGFQVTVPLYTSGGIDAAVAEADANYRKAQAKTRTFTLQVEADALSANTRLQPLMRRVSATERSVEAAGLMVRAMEMGIRAGLNSRAEAAAAIQELAAAQRQLVQLRLEYLSAWLTVEKSVSALNVERLEQFERFVVEKSAAEKLAAERVAVEKIAVEKVSVEQLASEKNLVPDRLAAQKATADQTSPAVSTLFRAQVEASLDDFANLWSARKPDAYLALFDPSFPDFSNYAETRRKRILAASFIEVKISNLTVRELTSGEITARFTQSYRSDRFQSQVTKELVWRETPNGPRIVLERTLN